MSKLFYTIVFLWYIFCYDLSYLTAMFILEEFNEQYKCGQEESNRPGIGK